TARSSPRKRRRGGANRHRRKTPCGRFRQARPPPPKPKTTNARRSRQGGPKSTWRFLDRTAWPYQAKLPTNDWHNRWRAEAKVGSAHEKGRQLPAFPYSGV